MPRKHKTIEELCLMPTMSVREVLESEMDFFGKDRSLRQDPDIYQPYNDIINMVITELQGSLSRFVAGVSADGQSASKFHRNFLHSRDHDISCLYKRVSRAMQGDVCKGTVIRLSSKGLIGGAYNVHFDKGEYVPLTAFGAPLELLASFNSYNFVFMRGPACEGSEDFFDLSGGPPTLGTTVYMIPAPDQQPGITDPAHCRGRVATVEATLELAAADYCTDMPNSLGGAVVYDTKMLAGIHVAILDHSTEAQQEQAPTDRTGVDKDKVSEDANEQATKRQKVEEAEPAYPCKIVPEFQAKYVKPLKFEGKLGIFLTVSRIIGLAGDAGIYSNPLRQPMSRLAAGRRKDYLS